MKIRECKLQYEESNVLWLLPEILLSGCEYAKDVQFDYKKWFQIQIVWIFWSFTLWIEYKKNYEHHHRTNQGRD